MQKNTGDSLKMSEIIKVGIADLKTCRGDDGVTTLGYISNASPAKSAVASSKAL